jgi:NAD(P)H-dependent FMN reductase
LNKLHIIICSTRPGRVGIGIAEWMHRSAHEHGKFETALIDLAEVNLPLYNEPKHPSLKQYQHDHTRRWSESVEAADAFIFVTPEYNYGPPPAFVNAVNYVYKEWNYKPASFVSYGGVSGGLRAVQVEKLTLMALKLAVICEAVTIPLVSQNLENGTFRANEIHQQSAAVMLDELARWAEALKPLRR